MAAPVSPARPIRIDVENPVTIGFSENRRLVRIGLTSGTDHLNLPENFLRSLRKVVRSVFPEAQGISFDLRNPNRLNICCGDGSQDVVLTLDGETPKVVGHGFFSIEVLSPLSDDQVVNAERIYAMVEKVNFLMQSLKAPFLEASESFALSQQRLSFELPPEAQRVLAMFREDSPEDDWDLGQERRKSLFSPTFFLQAAASALNPIVKSLKNIPFWDAERQIQQGAARGSLCLDILGAGGELVWEYTGHGATPLLLIHAARGVCKVVEGALEAHQSVQTQTVQTRKIDATTSGILTVVEGISCVAYSAAGNPGSSAVSSFFKPIRAGVKVASDRARHAEVARIANMMKLFEEIPCLPQRQLATLNFFRSTVILSPSEVRELFAREQMITPEARNEALVREKSRKRGELAKVMGSLLTQTIEGATKTTGIDSRRQTTQLDDEFTRLQSSAAVEANAANSALVTRIEGAVGEASPQLRDVSGISQDRMTTGGIFGVASVLGQVCPGKISSTLHLAERVFGIALDCQELPTGTGAFIGRALVQGCGALATAKDYVPVVRRLDGSQVEAVVERYVPAKVVRFVRGLGAPAVPADARVPQPPQGNGIDSRLLAAFARGVAAAQQEGQLPPPPPTTGSRLLFSSTQRAPQAAGIRSSSRASPSVHASGAHRARVSSATSSASSSSSEGAASSRSGLASSASSAAASGASTFPPARAVRIDSLSDEQVLEKCGQIVEELDRRGDL